MVGSARCSGERVDAAGQQVPRSVGPAHQDFHADKVGHLNVGQIDGVVTVSHVFKGRRQGRHFTFILGAKERLVTVEFEEKVNVGAAEDQGCVSNDLAESVERVKQLAETQFVDAKDLREMLQLAFVHVDQHFVRLTRVKHPLQFLNFSVSAEPNLFRRFAKSGRCRVKSPVTNAKKQNVFNFAHLTLEMCFNGGPNEQGRGGDGFPKFPENLSFFFRTSITRENRLLQRN
jgi:hypothetical protein